MRGITFFKNCLTWSKVESCAPSLELGWYFGGPFKNAPAHMPSTSCDPSTPVGSAMIRKLRMLSLLLTEPAPNPPVCPQLMVRKLQEQGQVRRRTTHLCREASGGEPGTRETRRRARGRQLLVLRWKRKKLNVSRLEGRFTTVPSLPKWVLRLKLHDYIGCFIFQTSV